MNKYIIPFIIIVLLSSCSTTYFEAGRKNVNRFEGSRENDAQYLLNLNDDLLLIENLSTVAMNKTNSKELYLSSLYLQEDIKDKAFRINVIAKSSRISLADQLSETADKKYHEIINLSDNLFDSAYVTFTREKLESIQSRLIDYKTTGKDESIVKLSVNLNKMVNEAQKRLPDLDDSVAKR